MAAVAEDGLTVLMSSHVIADLEAVYDWLVLLNRGKVQLAGAIEEILAGHRLLTGPRTDTDPSLPGVIRAAHSNRHTDLLVRTEADRPAGPHRGGPTCWSAPRRTDLLVRTEADRPDVHPAWQSHPVGLEELILAYLEHPTAVAS
ncbi:MAG: methionine transporter ATP-binding protein [Actinomycetia bacterium]|nr:methionine transporter ATP-binding protein [Actinomycetes bacterium]